MTDKKNRKAGPPMVRGGHVFQPVTDKPKPKASEKRERDEDVVLAQRLIDLAKRLSPDELRERVEALDQIKLNGWQEQVIDAYSKEVERVLFQGRRHGKTMLKADIIQNYVDELYKVTSTKGVTGPTVNVFTNPATHGRVYSVTMHDLDQDRLYARQVEIAEMSLHSETTQAEFAIRGVFKELQKKIDEDRVDSLLPPVEW